MGRREGRERADESVFFVKKAEVGARDMEGEKESRKYEGKDGKKEGKIKLEKRPYSDIGSGMAKW